MLKHLYAAILCGGGGKRLWPRSRIKKPKQFVKLFGKETIFQETVKRIKPLISPSKILVITNFDYVDEVREQAPEIPKENIIAEPQARNTALAMGVGAVYVKTRDPGGVIINLASDHLIKNTKEFRRRMLIAAKAASLGDYLLTVGIRPQFPHTGYGYIQVKREVARIDGEPIFKVERFTEKPNLATAKKFLKTGHYYWNANLYTWRAEAALKAFKRHVPKIARGLEKIEKAIGTKSEKKILKEVYEDVENISIDYAISEKAKNMLMVVGDFDWSDIGDWKVVYDLGKKDKNGNVIIKHGEEGEHLGIDTKNCLVHFDDELIATVGVENLIIVDAGNLILVCNKDKAQDVKKIVQELKQRGKKKYL